MPKLTHCGKQWRLNQLPGSLNPRGDPEVLNSNCLPGPALAAAATWEVNHAWKISLSQPLPLSATLIFKYLNPLKKKAEKTGSVFQLSVEDRS